MMHRQVAKEKMAFLEKSKRPNKSSTRVHAGDDVCVHETVVLPEGVSNNHGSV